MIPFPEKKYQIIYADPPWKYGDALFTDASVYYPVMGYRDICKLPVEKIADRDCILFIWVTFPMLREGLEVITEWRFEYKTVAFTWVKLNPIDRKPFFGTGHYTRSNAEICLLATKGDALKLVKSNFVSQVIITPRFKHSEKPKEARDNILQLVGDLPRIELFARPPKDILFEDERYKGWDLWGNEI